MARVDVPDLYKIIGVDKTATDEEIKKAYRRLSKELHPDINKDPSAPKKFEKLHAAYLILSDPEKRKEYDEDVERGGPKLQFDASFAHVFDTFFKNERTARQPVNGEHIWVNVSFTAYEALTEAVKEVRLQRKRVCPDCDGTTFATSSIEKCSECGGSGGTLKAVFTPMGNLDTRTRCEACKGTGKAKNVPCLTCAQKGSLPDDVNFPFQLPKEVIDGFVKSYPGEGNPGRDGGVNGSLFVKFMHSNKDRFTIEETYDLVTRQSVPLDILLTGGTVPFVSPRGETIDLPIQQGMTIGNRISLPDQGLYIDSKGWHGVCYVELDVRIPQLSGQELTRVVNILRKHASE